MVLTKYDIESLCVTKKMVEEYKEENIQANSYDLCMGNQYCCYDDIKSEESIVSELGDKTSNDEFEIPADAICYVITNEILNIPENVTGDVSLAFGLIKQGIMLAKQPPIDPGYKGRIVALLHNLSDEPVRIRKGDHILSMVFYELKQEIKDDDLYQGSYQNLMDLETYCQTVKRGAVYSLAKDFKKTKEDVEEKFECFKEEIKADTGKRSERVLNYITVIIAIVTILLTFITIVLTMKTFSNEDDAEANVALEQTMENEDQVIEFGNYKVKVVNGSIVNMVIDETNREILIDIEMDGDEND